MQYLWTFHHLRHNTYVPRHLAGLTQVLHGIRWTHIYSSYLIFVISDQAQSSNYSNLHFILRE